MYTLGSSFQINERPHDLAISFIVFFGLAKRSLMPNCMLNDILGGGAIERRAFDSKSESRFNDALQQCEVGDRGPGIIANDNDDGERGPYVTRA